VIQEDVPYDLRPVYELPPQYAEIAGEVRRKFDLQSDYAAFHLLHHFGQLAGLAEADRRYLSGLVQEQRFQSELAQSVEIVERYKRIDQVIARAVTAGAAGSRNLTRRLDRVLAHPLAGYLVFLLIMFLIFQSIFAWATAPMDFIDFTFSEISVYLKEILPPGLLTGLISEGIVPGIGGVVIFVPQIALLFAFISLLEESGYMSRVVFLLDRPMRRFGLNGRSVVPLISGMACAIPAIMATRTIDNWRERLITILVTPFMSCSARLPVYTILIALVVPDEYIFGFLNLQGLTLMVLYLLGFVTAILSAGLLKYFIRLRDRSYLIMEFRSTRSRAGATWSSACSTSPGPSCSRRERSSWPYPSSCG
jgi:ferrous iron transport protein B